MSTTKVIQTKNIKGLIDYVQGTMYGEYFHSLSNERVAYFSSLNCSFGNARNEMYDYIKQLGKEDNVQGLHVIQTFSKDELDPNDVNSLQRANEAGYELANELYPNHQVIVVTQNDGESGLIHNHIVINQSNLIDGKSLKNEQKNHFHVAKTNDIVLERLNIDNVLAGKKAYYRDDKSHNEEYVRDAGEYVWKDDLRERLDDILGSEPESFDEFKEWCEQQGISIEIKTRKRGSDYQYHFTDIYGKKRHAMGKRLDSESEKYKKESVDEAIEENQVQAVQMAIPEPEPVSEMTDKEKKKFKYRLDNTNYWENDIRYLSKKYPHYADYFEEYKTERYETMKQEEQRREQLNREAMEEVSLNGSKEPLDVGKGSGDVSVASTSKTPETGYGGLSDDELMAKFRVARLNAYGSDINSNQKQKSEREFGD